MAAMTLPPVNPTPIPTQLVAPPSPRAGDAAGNAAGPGSFSQLLEAADARRQSDAPEPAPAAPASPEKTAQNTAARPQAPAPKTPTRDGTKAGGAQAPTDADNNTAERAGAEAEAASNDLADEAAAPHDAASLLASLGLINRPHLPPAEASATRGRAGVSRLAPDAAVDALQARAGTAADAAGAGAALAAELSATAATAERGAAGKAFAELLAAAQGSETTSDTAAVALVEQRLAPQAEARPADASALGSLLGTHAAPAMHAAGSSAAHPAEARLGTTPGQAGFAEQLGAQLSTFVRDGVQHARLQLHPLELGPVTVQIELHGGSAHLSFAAEHAQTRQALEQALPTLAGSLREAGLTLSGGGVFEQPRQPQPEGDGGRGDGTGARGGRGGSGGEGEGNGDQGLLQMAASSSQRRRGVVDLMA